MRHVHIAWRQAFSALYRKISRTTVPVCWESYEKPPNVKPRSAAFAVLGRFLVVTSTLVHDYARIGGPVTLFAVSSEIFYLFVPASFSPAARSNK